MLHGRLPGEADSRTDRVRQVGYLPRQQSQSGKIASISDAAFLLEVTQG
jgi:hypothetical protein